MAAIQEVQQLMREVSFEDYVQGRVAANRQAGQDDPSQRPSNVVGDIETDSDAEPSEEELDSTTQFVRDKRIAMKGRSRTTPARFTRHLEATGIARFQVLGLPDQRSV